MSKLILKGIDFGAENLDVYIPQTPNNFCVWLTLAIGSIDVEGTNLFQVGVCTVTWLEHQLSGKDAYPMRHMILVERFDVEVIKKEIHKIMLDAERPTWEQSVSVLSRHFAWEFEDYQP